MMLTQYQKELIDEYYQQYGYNHIKHCISKVFKRQLEGAVLDDYIGVAEEAICKAALRYKGDKGAKFATFAEMHIVSQLKTVIRDKNRMKRIPESNIDSLDRVVDPETKSTLGDIIEYIESDKEDNFIGTYEYLKRLNTKQCIIVILRLLGADFSEIYKLMDMPVSQVKSLIKRMTSYENRSELIKVRRDRDA